MSGRYALDTNVAIAVLNGEEEAVAQWQTAEEVLLPAPVLGEPLYGAAKSRRPEENATRARTLAAAMDFQPCDAAVCARYADLKLALARIGRPMPTNDLWIAACCLEAGAVIVSRDTHFDGVPGLEREEW